MKYIVFPVFGSVLIIVIWTIQAIWNPTVFTKENFKINFSSYKYKFWTAYAFDSIMWWVETGFIWSN